MTKPKVKPDVLTKLRAVIEDATPGRAQRGISWPAPMDEAVNAYLEATGMERSTLVQIAVAHYLELPPSAFPKVSSRTPLPGQSRRGVEYVPISELELQPA